MSITATITLTKYISRLKKRGFDPTNSKELINYVCSLIDKDLGPEEKEEGNK